ncbi:hypothetical protein ACFQU7_08400 [Pseudoroseomonas wenyumeiae]
MFIGFWGLVTYGGLVPPLFLASLGRRWPRAGRCSPNTALFMTSA